MKAGTKLCQESVNNYINLKKEVTSQKLDPELPVTPRKDAKLFIKNLDIACKNHYNNREFKPANRQRSKTESASNMILHKNVINKKTLRMKMAAGTRSR